LLLNLSDNYQKQVKFNSILYFPRMTKDGPGGI
jgi:hypothetical protein